MTTAPMKSQQPLHNFSLPYLKWGQRTIVNSTTTTEFDKEVVSEAEDGGGGVTKARSLRPRRGGGNETAMMTVIEKRENMRLWISLSREEIEDDLYAMTGLKPSRRPKKRPKSVQKHLDNLFPGLCMVGYTADTYRAHDFLK